MSKSKKDVIFLCQFFYPEYISSATLPYDTAKALVDSGLSVGVLCGYPKEYYSGAHVPKRENKDGIEIKRLKYLQLNRSNMIGRLINYFSFTLSALFNLRMLKRFDSVIVYSNPPVLPIVAIFANIFYGIKIMFVSYDVYPEIAIRTQSIPEKGVISGIMRKINKSLFPRVNRVIALSDEMREVISKQRDVDIEKISVIPNWYENKESREAEESWSNEKFNQHFSHKDFIISNLGNMGVAQDIETLLNAIRQLSHVRQVKFLFAGHGSKLAEIREIVAKDGLCNVFIYDFLHADDYEDALNISDVLIVSLAKGVDGLAVPSRVYSYMQAAKPIIAIMESHTDISKDLFQYEAGYSIKNNDTEHLIKNIMSLYTDPLSKQSMGQNARRLFESKYTKEISTKKYIEIFSGHGNKELNKN